VQSSKGIPRGLLPALLCLLSVLLAACGSTGNSSTTTAKAPATHQIFDNPLGGASDIKSFDPGLATDNDSVMAVDMVFTGLVELDDNLQIKDQLAASHSVAADGTTWTFKLRPNLKFSDGTSLTSADVAYSIDRALDPALKSPISPAYLNLILDSDKRLNGKIKSLIGDSLITPDPQTIIIKTNKKAAYFLDALTYTCSYIIEKSMIDRYGNNFADHLAEGIGGAGPFKVSRYVHGQEIEFVPNPYYYGPKPQLRKVIFPFYQKQDTTYDAYQANQVDQAYVPSAHITQAMALPNRQFHQIPQLWINYYTMNYLTRPFDNIKVRQAFALAINKDEIVRDVYKGSFIATNHIVPQGMPGYFPALTGPAGVKGTAGDVDLARQLFREGLQEEGLTLATLPPITMTYSSSGNADMRNELAAVQQMWQNVLGVNVKLNDIDSDQLGSEQFAATNNPKGLQMWAGYWVADYPDPQDWLTLQFDNGAQNNNSNYGQNKSSDADLQQQTQQLMEQADINHNQLERLQQYNQAEQQLINDVAWIPMYQETIRIVRKSCVIGFVDNAEYLIPPDDWGNIYKSTATPCANVTQYQ
jgi:oligopeptide transport system substrate-binding protein